MRAHVYAGIVAVLLVAGCGGGGQKTAPADAGAAACEAYVAAYDACFDRLGPAARAAGDRALVAAKQRLTQGADENGARKARCEAAAKQLAAACR